MDLQNTDENNPIVDVVDDSDAKTIEQSESKSDEKTSEKNQSIQKEMGNKSLSSLRNVATTSKETSQIQREDTETLANNNNKETIQIDDEVQIIERNDLHVKSSIPVTTNNTNANDSEKNEEISSEISTIENSASEEPMDIDEILDSIQADQEINISEEDADEANIKTNAYDVEQKITEKKAISCINILDGNTLNSFLYQFFTQSYFLQIFHSNF